MKIEIINDDESSITATRAEWAVLWKLLDWVSDDYKLMDEGKILLEEDEIPNHIQEWVSAINKARP